MLYINFCAAFLPYAAFTVNLLLWMVFWYWA